MMLVVATACSRKPSAPASAEDASVAPSPARRLALGDTGYEPTTHEPVITTGGCVRSSAERWRCWHWKDFAALTAVEIPAPEARDIVFGDRYRCFIHASDGAVACGGNNRQGQLGDGTAIDHKEPVVNGSKGAIKLATQEQRTCALIDNGGVDCWGWVFGTDVNVHTLRSGEERPSSPRRTMGVRVIDIALMPSGALCKLRVDDVVECEDADALTRPPGAEHLTRVFVGDKRAVCVLDAAGTLFCANRTASEAHFDPFVVVERNVADASFQPGAAVVLDRSGNVLRWISDGARRPGQPQTHDVLSSKAVAIATGSYDEACALEEDGSIRCWSNEKPPRVMTWVK